MRLRDLVGAPAPDLVRLLAPNGVLRAAINMSNFLLVSSRTPDGGPAGVSPDMAAAFADLLGVELQRVPYESPGLVSDAADRGEWDIALIGAEPQRAEFIAFTPAYSEIEASYLVPPGSSIQRIEEVDQPGRRIAVTDRTAYGLWLDRNIRHAELVRTTTLDDAVTTFLDEKLDALAGLRPRLVTDEKAIPGSRILPGRYMSVQQALGTPKRNAAALGYMKRFVSAAIATGFVAGLIARHGVEGLTVAADAS
jgi:polar amino acid transport system substrate-binding protein